MPEADKEAKSEHGQEKQCIYTFPPPLLTFINTSAPNGWSVLEIPFLCINAVKVIDSESDGSRLEFQFNHLPTVSPWASYQPLSFPSVKWVE